ncbi:toll/interleukin-1 receptor domain-containing protein [Methanobrevibacter millerae]|uniref:TIR domain-containing protein n=1 Tax=Methanobrevibacter millerae TaxID=230361 RepID=A0A1G5VT31_9EURY|nr:toll/interleukin-1 receptor domain-containing protein [Methanobrevibacter millerae]SDA48908.1 TIR domain-containing protein [Methanobrevibacter millerae]
MEDVRDHNHLRALIFQKEGYVSLNYDISLNRSIDIRNNNLTIDGNGHTIDANGKNRIFNVTGKNVVLKNFIFKNGKAPTGLFADGKGYGGVIRNNGQLELNNCQFINNVAKNDGNDIVNNSELKIINCSFSQNNNSKYSILNNGSIKICENQLETLEPFISGGKINFISKPKITVDVFGTEGMGTDYPIHMIDRPFDAYSGSERYIFASYAHVDAKEVFAELKRFHEDGFKIWYDDGIRSGEGWQEVVETALEDSSLFIVFLTPNSVESKNVRDEIFLAIHEDIPLIPIYLEKTELKYGLKLTLLNLQSIFKYEMPENDYICRYKNDFSRYVGT